MFKDSKILVVGLARSGLAAARILNQSGARVTGYDKKPVEELGPGIDELVPKGVQFLTGDQPDLSQFDFDMVVASPGISLELAVFKQAVQLSIPIIGELELAYRLKAAQVDMLAVTGTNGKTTTTSLLQYILELDGQPAFYGGNIGIALTSLVGSLQEGVIAVEVSSFQLETADQFHPVICGILNITPDHLDRHKTMTAYTEIKSRVFRRQTPQDYTVLNYDDPLLQEISAQCPGQVIYFSNQHKLESGFCIDEGYIVYKHSSGQEAICPVSELRLRGQHNLENVLCAAAMSYLYGVKPEVIRKALASFNGVRHRMEEVIDCQGVLFINDSKATNPDSAIKALQSFDQPIILIAGGRNKGSDFTEFAQVIDERVRELILLGEARDEIKGAVMKTPFRNIHEVNDITEAVTLSVELAQEGDIVLLSPACASWDQFPSYEHRGDLFCELARRYQQVDK